MVTSVSVPVIGSSGVSGVGSSGSGSGVGSSGSGSTTSFVAYTVIELNLVAPPEFVNVNVFVG